MPVTFELPDTIVASATAPVPGGVAVLRVSGPRALEAVRPLCPKLPSAPVPRHAYLTAVRSAAGAELDEGLALYFQGPKSFTGEDVVELHLHGSPRLVQLVQEALLEQTPGLRIAEPGEFTRRAFLNGRMDLSRAEAVADLVSAQSEAAVRAATSQLRGALGARLEAVRIPLLELRADVEGVLEFPDEAAEADEDVGPRVQQLLESLQALLGTARQGQLLRRGARVALFGPVNAGKSTLFNCLVGEARALVDPEPGTTRDVLEARLELGGVAVTLLDTAGLRASPGRIEALGIARAKEALTSANVAVLVLPPEATAEEAEAWRAEARGTPLVVVRGKADLGGRGQGILSADVAVSGSTGEGVATLRELLLGRLGLTGTVEAVVSVSERHEEALGRAMKHLEQAAGAAKTSTLEVVSGELGFALEALCEVTGENASETLLDEVFRRFCIGK